MVINVDDFRGPLFGAPFVGTLNYKKILNLPDKDFAEFYLKLMEEYRDADGWWGKGKEIIPCSKCNEKISGPKELRRLYGRTLDPSCFDEEMKIELPNKRGLEQKYWKRVLEVDFSLLSE